MQGVVHRVDDGPGAQKQERLEEGVCHEMKDACRVRPHADTQEHVAQLGDRGIGQHLLDVVLLQGDRRGEERSKHTDSRHHSATQRRECEQDGGPRDQVDPCGHHGGRMDEGGHRRRTRHGIGQPDVEGDLGALTRCSHEKKQCHRGDHRAAVLENGLGVTKDAGEVHPLENEVQQENRKQETQITDPVHDERLLPCGSLRLVAEPESDQEVGAEPHTLPADEHDRIAGSHHQHQHEENEQVQVCEVPGVTWIILHVPHAEHVDQQPHSCDDQHHDHRELIELDRGGHLQLPRADPRPIATDHGLVQLGTEHPDEVHQREQESQEHHPGPHPRG